MFSTEQLYGQLTIVIIFSLKHNLQCYCIMMIFGPQEIKHRMVIVEFKAEAEKPNDQENSKYIVTTVWSIGVGTVKQNKYKTPIKPLITPLIVIVKQFVINNTVSTTNQMKIVHME